MKRHTLPRFAIALFAMALLSTAWAQSPEERAAQVIDQLEAGQFEELAATFNPQMQASVSTEQLAQGWNALPQQIGTLQSRGEPAVSTQGEHEIVVVPLQYEHAVINATIVFDGEGLVAGLMLQPAQEEGAPDPQD